MRRRAGQWLLAVALVALAAVKLAAAWRYGIGPDGAAWLLFALAVPAVAIIGNLADRTRP